MGFVLASDYKWNDKQSSKPIHFRFAAGRKENMLIFIGSDMGKESQFISISLSKDAKRFCERKLLLAWFLFGIIVSSYPFV